LRNGRAGAEDAAIWATLVLPAGAPALEFKTKTV
jgi:hypothetical protein